MVPTPYIEAIKKFELLTLLPTHLGKVRRVIFAVLSAACILFTYYECSVLTQWLAFALIQDGARFAPTLDNPDAVFIYVPWAVTTLTAFDHSRPARQGGFGQFATIEISTCWLPLKRFT